MLSAAPARHRQVRIAHHEVERRARASVAAAQAAPNVALTASTTPGNRQLYPRRPTGVRTRSITTRTSGSAIAAIAPQTAVRAVERFSIVRLRSARARTRANVAPLSAPHAVHAATNSDTETGRKMTSDGCAGRESAYRASAKPIGSQTSAQMRAIVAVARSRRSTAMSADVSLGGASSAPHNASDDLQTACCREKHWQERDNSPSGKAQAIVKRGNCVKVIQAERRTKLRHR